MTKRMDWRRARKHRGFEQATPVSFDRHPDRLERAADRLLDPPKTKPSPKPPKRRQHVWDRMAADVQTTVGKDFKPDAEGDPF